jgi:hypothetical protein
MAYFFRDPILRKQLRHMVLQLNIHGDAYLHCAFIIEIGCAYEWHTAGHIVHEAEWGFIFEDLSSYPPASHVRGLLLKLLRAKA